MLADAAESVAAQTYDRVELVVVDDGSRTAQEALEGVALDALERTRVRSLPDRRGANAARNAGVDAAEGDLVAFLDDDDWWYPAKLDRQVRALRAADAGVAFAGQRVVREGRVTATRRPPTGGDFFERLVVGAPFGPFSAVLVRASAFDRAGPLDESLPCWQDREWYFRLSEHCEFVGVPDLLVGRRVAADDRVSDRYAGLRDVVYPRLRRRYRERARALGPTYERRFLATLLAAVGIGAVQCREYGEARRFLGRSVRLDPTRPRRLGYLAAALGGRPAHRALQTAKRTASRLRDGGPAGSVDGIAVPSN